MTTTASERQKILGQLNTLAVEDLVKLWRTASGMDLESRAFRQLIEQAYPDIPARWGTAASELATQWYDDAAPDLAYRATPAPLHPVEQYAGNARWALGAAGDAALDRLVADLQWSLFDMARSTTMLNAESERGSRWARYASATACMFCRVMATRGAVYSSEAAATTVVGRGKEMSQSDRRARARGETRDSRHRFIAGGRQTRGSRSLGEGYHPSCHCIAVEVRPGTSYQPPPYVEQWERDYVAATRATDGSTNAVLAHMGASDRGRSALPPGPGASASTAQSGPGGRVPPRVPPNRGTSAAAGMPDRNFNFAEFLVPSEYPTMVDGSKVRFTPHARPAVDSRTREHIWDGEPNLPTKGGHRSGVGRPSKGEYPSAWDNAALDSAIDEVLAFPQAVSESGGITTFKGAVERNGQRVAMAVQTNIVDGEPRVWTAFPLNGDGVIYNDRKNGPVNRPFNPAVVRPKEPRR